MDEQNVPKILKHKVYFNGQAEPFENERDAYAPLVWQCRYGGVEVPDHLWQHCTSGKGKKYSDNQAEDLIKENGFMQTFDHWTAGFKTFVAEKGKITPGRYRAYGFTQPLHLLNELKTGIRSWKLRFGMPPKDSSPGQQEVLGLNDDITLYPKMYEGKKLRKS